MVNCTDTTALWAGTSTLTIRETQRRSWSADGVLTVTSKPLLDFVGGSKFTTDAEFVVRPGEGGCQVGQRCAWDKCASGGLHGGRKCHV